VLLASPKIGSLAGDNPPKFVSGAAPQHERIIPAKSTLVGEIGCIVTVPIS
jgi:hypothetical protein